MVSRERIETDGEKQQKQEALEGQWVQIHQIVLPAGERAPRVPDDTEEVPLELRVKGFLQAAARVGDEVEIETYTGRRLRGILEDPDPSYEHKFGRPIPELLEVGRQLRSILEGGEKDAGS